MTSLNRLKYALPVVFVFAGSTTAWSVPIAIIDSGTDLKHPSLVNHAWTNPGDTAEDNQDNDTNGYIDDIHGWNFSENPNNNKIIDYAYLGKFSPDVTKFFEVQLRVLEGTATEEDKKWIEEKRKDQKFIQELSTFGNFVHGTHVAGIAVKSAPDAKIMAAKIIPTEVKLPGGLADISSLTPFSFFNPLAGFLDDFVMQGALGFLAGQQTKSLTTVGEYVAKTKMQVANCSFGTSMVQAKMVVGMIGKALLQRDLTDEEVLKYATYFLSQVIEKGASFVQSSKQTLFVMAAGNDGTDNDKLPVFPANLKLDNTISVAATRGYDRLASFSNYGVSKVEIAAPGVGIRSAIPGTDYMPLSGTSQAAPFITHLIGKVLDTNSKLTHTQVKQILMQTVDKKSFLADKVVSGGIANEERALKAASYSKSLSLDEAINRSKLEVADIGTAGSGTMRDGLDRDSISEDSGYDGEPIPLPSIFSMLK
jgi:subtilisin family serine protease